MSTKFLESKKSSIEEELLPSNEEKTNLFREIVDTIKTRGIKIVNLDPYKSSLNLPIEKLPDSDEVVSIYERLVKKNRQSKKNWSFYENQLLIWLVLNYCLIKEINPLSIPEKEISEVLSIFPGKTLDQTKFKWFSLRKCHLYSTPWTKEEDEILRKLIIEKGSNKWNEISKEMNRISGSSVFRLGKQCRERWNNHLDPNLNRGPWTKEEDLVLLNSIMEIGKKWSDIAKKLVGRTENSVKNRFISLMNKEKSLLSLEEEINDLPNEDSIDSQTSDDIEEAAVIKSLIYSMEREAGEEVKSSKTKKNVQVKKNLLMDLINQEKKSKEEECESNNSTKINNFKIFTPNIDASRTQLREDLNNTDNLLGKNNLYNCLSESILKNNPKTPANIASTLTTPNVNYDPIKLGSTPNGTPSNLQEVLKKDFASFFLGNQNPLVTLVHGIQLIRFSLLMFQKEGNKSTEAPPMIQEKKVVNIKDFNSLIYENNFQDLQLSFLNPIKNDVYLLNPMTEQELSQLEMNVETQNALLNFSKLNNLASSNFLSMPQNFSPFPMNFTPIINRAHPGFPNQNLLNANNLMGFTGLNSSFSSPAVNFNYYGNPHTTDFFLTKILENMNTSKGPEHSNYSSTNNLNNSVNFNNNSTNGPGQNNNVNVKMELDEESGLLRKKTKDF